MKQEQISKLLEEFYNEIRPHINGHKSAINKFFTALDAIKYPKHSESPQHPEQGVVFGEWQRCPVCYGNGQILEDGFISSVYQTCPTCEGNRIIQKPIIIPTH